MPSEDRIGIRVALYARCSTKDKGQNPDTQLIPLREFARHRQLEIAEEYVDLGLEWSKRTPAPARPADGGREAKEV